MAINLLIFASAGLSCGKILEGQLVLQPKQARVVSKFVFDFHPGCSEGSCPADAVPGLLKIQVYDFSPVESRALKSPLNGSSLFLAMLDDEYFSFSKVSKVWDELSCQEVLAAAKRSFPVSWTLASTPTGDHIQTSVLQKLRPRWWYIAFVSCSDYTLAASYRMHFQNLLQGWQQEFSMDTIGVLPATICLCIAFAYLCYAQLCSLIAWRRECRACKLFQLHPALLILTTASCSALLGQACWAKYYTHYAWGGESLPSWSFLGRSFTVAGKTMVSLLLLLFAHGECVCTPDIAWSRRQELVWGLVLFGLLSCALEIWGDSESRNSAVEYVYDTQAGILLVAFDLLLFWLYASRTWKTIQQETRAKPKVFYKVFAPVLSLWFVALPVIASVASILSPWVRFRIIFFAHSSVHVVALWILVYSFRPATASRFYDLQMTECVPLCREELEHM